MFVLYLFAVVYIDCYCVLQFSMHLCTNFKDLLMPQSQGSLRNIKFLKWPIGGFLIKVCLEKSIAIAFL